MKKRWIVSILAACLLLAVLAPGAYALEVNLASGTCGDGLSWSLDGYTLTISGSGEMAEGSPWEAYQDHIEHIVFTGGVTKICDNAFSGYDRVKTVDFGDSLVEIGAKAFYGCKNLSYIHLPASFRIFGAESFRNCTGLKYVYCDGGMPRFSDSCLWTGEYVAVFYPTNNIWPQDSVYQLISSFGGKLGVMMGNFDASAVNAAAQETDQTAEETKAAAEVPTEAPAEAPAEAPTEAAPEPVPVPTIQGVTEPVETTVPETQAPTVPATEAVPTTEAAEITQATQETQERTVVEKVGGDGWIGVVLIAAVLTVLLIGALIFRGSRNKGGRYTE